MWQDCWDYEASCGSSAGTNQYTPFPAGACDPNNKTSVYNLGIDSPMNYWFVASSNTVTKIYQDSQQFNETTWPTPRQMLSTGYYTGVGSTPGYRGVNYAYVGYDPILKVADALYGAKFCPNNILGWNLVNQTGTNPNPTAKRDVEAKRDIEKKKGANPNNNNGHLERIISVYTSKFEEFKLKNNNDAHEAFQALAMWDCQNSPKMELTENFEQWLMMNNNLQASQFNSICDDVGGRWKAKKEALMDAEKSKQSTFAILTQYPLALVGVGVGVFALIGIAAGVGYYKTKRSQTDSDNEYNKL